MERLRIRKKQEKKLIGNKTRHYIDFLILICCSVIAFNIHPVNTNNDTKNIDSNDNLEKSEMIYIFHDYKGNEYIMNENIHGTSNSRDYLFDDKIPEDLKLESTKVSGLIPLNNYHNITDNETSNNNSESIKDNQVSIEDIISDLGLDDNEENNDTLMINTGDNESTSENNSYYIVNNWSGNGISYLTIEKINNNGEIENGGNNQDENGAENKETNDENNKIAKAFTFIEEGRIIPVLVPRNDIYFGDSEEPVEYEMNISGNNGNSNNNTKNGQNKEPGITIIEDYEDCMTPWGYKIMHGESVLAYKQMDDAPDICNIERRFCWKGKLSGTYTQQGCSINENYTYKQRGEAEVTPKTKDKFNGNGTVQNPDGTVSVKYKEIGGSNNSVPITDFNNSNNLREEEQGVSQKTRVYWGCTAPRGEKINHGEFVQAFKHANGFSDSPCEAQIRLCSMGELLGTYTESTCKTRNTSFIDWINGSPTRSTYSQEKLELVKKQIENEEKYYKNARKDGEKSLDSDALDRILWILEKD